MDPDRYSGVIDGESRRAARRYGLDPDDVAQQARLNLLSVPCDGLSRRSYVATAVRNTAYALRRPRIAGRAREVGYYGRRRDRVESDASRVAARIDVAAALESLPPFEREAVTLVHLDGLSTREAAAAMGATQTRVLRAAARACAALAPSLAAYAPES